MFPMHSELLVFPDSASGISAAKRGKQALIGTVALAISFRDMKMSLP
jgi:hypothetical protein